MALSVEVSDGNSRFGAHKIALVTRTRHRDLLQTEVGMLELDGEYLSRVI